MPHIPFSLSSGQLSKYNYRCAYCHRLMNLENYSFFESDHIYPASKSGSDMVENRAPACRRCNQNKSNKTEWKDPMSGHIVPLFNPRYDIWHDHLEISKFSGVIIGKTPIGRATVDLLGLDKQTQNPMLLFRGNVFLEAENDILLQLAFLRHLRLTCDFTNVINLGRIMYQSELIRSSNYVFDIQILIAVQIIEAYLTRSENQADILAGLYYALNCKNYFAKLTRYSRNLFIFDHLITTFCKQLLTLNYPNFKLLEKIIRSNLLRENSTFKMDKFENVLLNVYWNCRLGGRIHENDVKHIFNNLETIEKYLEENPSKYIDSLMKVLDIIPNHLHIFKGKSDYIAENVIRSSELIRTHYSYDFALNSMFQRRTMRLDMNYNLSKHILDKDSLLRIAKKHKLYNEIRRLHESK